MHRAPPHLATRCRTARLLLCRLSQETFAWTSKIRLHSLPKMVACQAVIRGIGCSCLPHPQPAPPSSPSRLRVGQTPQAGAIPLLLLGASQMQPPCYIRHALTLLVNLHPAVPTQRCRRQWVPPLGQLLVWQCLRCLPAKVYLLTPSRRGDFDGPLSLGPASQPPYPLFDCRLLTFHVDNWRRSFSGLPHPQAAQTEGRRRRC